MSKNTTPPKSATVTDTLRWHLKNCGESNLTLERKLGIDNSTFSRFASGKRGLGLGAFDVLCKYFKLRLTRQRRPARERR